MDNCCETNLYLRPKSKPDASSFKSIFQKHDLRMLYPLFRNFTAKYVLDAGPGAGLTTKMLKQVLPSTSVVVALESDAASFETLLMNTRE